MHWYEPAAWFFAGAFLANAVPHFVQGVCGNRFPTPFANPPGKGLSSPLVNTVWGLGNFVVGALLFCAGQVRGHGWPAFLVAFAGAAALSIPMSIRFASKHTE
jgi:hypothetical protein